MFENEKAMLLSNFDEDVIRLFKEAGVIIAGGAITSIFTGREINDFDCYVKTKEGWCKILREMYGYNADNTVASFDLHVCHYTQRSILVTHDIDKKIQLIGMRPFESAWDIFRSFDFTINMGAYDFQQEKFTLHVDFMKHNAQRYLSFNEKTDFPLVSALRVDKYQQRGYTISKAQMFRILLACNLKSFKSWEDFKNELGGLYGLNPDEVVDTSKEFSIEEGMAQLANIFKDNSKFEQKSNPSFSELFNNFPQMIDDKSREWYDSNKDAMGMFNPYAKDYNDILADFF